jgi:hypothetical protein
MQLIMCAENGEWCVGISYKVCGHACTQLTVNSGGDQILKSIIFFFIYVTIPH